MSVAAEVTIAKVRMGRSKRYLGSRGSRRRLREIAFWENWSTEMTIALIAALLGAFVLIPWLSRHLSF